MKQIAVPKISEILKSEFMDPLGISAYRLAKEIGVPVSRIQDLLHDRRDVTIDTSIRLGRLFGVSDSYFLNLQNDINFRNTENKNNAEYNQIKEYRSSSDIKRNDIDVG